MLEDMDSVDNANPVNAMGSYGFLSWYVTMMALDVTYCGAKVARVNDWNAFIALLDELGRDEIRQRNYVIEMPKHVLHT